MSARRLRGERGEGVAASVGRDLVDLCRRGDGTVVLGDRQHDLDVRGQVPDEIERIGRLGDRPPDGRCRNVGGTLRQSQQREAGLGS